MKLWLTFEEAAPFTGATPEEMKEAMRLGDFPWDYVRLGPEIKISARSIGLDPALFDDEFIRLVEELSRIPATRKTRSQVNLAGTSCDRVVNR